MSPSSLSGRICVVTGGGSGLGLECVRKLLAANAKVCVIDINKENAEKSLAGALPTENVHLIEADVTNKNQFKNAIALAQDHFKGPVQVMCNNAGIGDETSVDRTVDLNLKAVIYGTEFALQSMKEAKVSGVVINVASMGGLIPMGFAPYYAASKAGVVHYTRSIAEKIASYNKRMSTSDPNTGAIRVNTLCPSFLETPLLATLRKDSPAGKGAIESLGRVMTVSEVADSFMELVTNESLTDKVMRITNQGTSFVTYK